MCLQPWSRRHLRARSEDPRGHPLRLRRARPQWRVSGRYRQHEGRHHGLGHGRERQPRLAIGGDLRGAHAIGLGPLLRPGSRAARQRRGGPRHPAVVHGDLAVQVGVGRAQRLGRGPVLRPWLVALLQHRPGCEGVGREPVDMRARLYRALLRGLLRLRLRRRTIRGRRRREVHRRLRRGRQWREGVATARGKAPPEARR
mmetsp:Transcript_41148/g.132410  ORF Transcript_41148/g.132410 Transcript_41148/m.132410 type:complete len:200 (-) Transcript_41148:7-606(-)